MWINILFIFLHVATLSLVGTLYFKLYKFKKIISIIKNKLKQMDIEIDPFLEELIAEKPISKLITAVGPNINTKVKVVDPEKVAIYRQRIAELISGGNAKEYLGKHMTLDQLGIMSDKEVEKCYAIYEAKIGLKMTKSLGQSIINLYTASVGHLFNVDNNEKLAKDLSDDPTINASLSALSSYMYFQYGSILAPLSAGIITFAHIINKNNNNNNNNSIIDNGIECNDSATNSNFSGITPGTDK